MQICNSEPSCSFSLVHRPIVLASTDQRHLHHWDLLCERHFQRAGALRAIHPCEISFAAFRSFPCDRTSPLSFPSLYPLSYVPTRSVNQVTSVKCIFIFRQWAFAIYSVQCQLGIRPIHSDPSSSSHLLLACPLSPLFIFTALISR